MNFTVSEELIIQIMESKPTLTIDGYNAEPQADRIEEMVKAIAEVQASVNWFLQMPKTRILSKNSPFSYEVKHRIECPTRLHIQYISTGAAILGAIICGFPISERFERIGIDEKYYQKWYELRMKGHQSVWMLT